MNLGSVIMEMTFRQKDSIRKSLSSTGKRKAINDYCNERGKNWIDLPLEEANKVIEKLVKMS